MERIELIQTNDGKQFKTLQLAELHITDKIREVLDNTLYGIVNKGLLKRHHIIDVINYLIPDYESAKSLIKDLNDVFEELEEE